MNHAAPTETMPELESPGRFCPSSDGADCGDLDGISTIILLMAFSLWMDDPALLSEALEVQTPLAHALSQDDLHDLEGRTRPDDWQDWVAAERRRRTKHIGFAC